LASTLSAALSGFPFRRLAMVAMVPLLLVAAGTVGYHLVEGWSYADALWMTVITLTTIGYSEVHTLSSGGRAFTMLLAMGGIFALFYAATELIRSVVSGEIASLLGRQRMERSLGSLEQHVIVCGYGRMGRFVCREFSAMKMPFAVIERDAAALADFDVPHGIPLHGDATSDEILRKAGLARARALVTVVASDADNLYITMSARFMSDRLFIVARAEDEAAVDKLTRAGASRVISPYLLSGHRVAQAVVRPAVLDFIELATRRGHLELQIEETQLLARSPLVGKKLAETGLRDGLGIVVVAVRKPDGRMIVNPPAESILDDGDVIVSLAHRDQLDRLEALARG
jgi:voltage-gated potassium channel